MKDLTIEQFVRENLPQYENRRVAHCHTFNGVGFTYHDHVKWHTDVFPEALAAYSERLCREQREIIAGHYVDAPNLYTSEALARDTALMAPSPSFTRTK